GGAAGTGSPVMAEAQRAYDEHAEPLAMAWSSLVDRVAALASYEMHLAELAPVVAAYSRLDLLRGPRSGRDIDTLYTAAARNELAADDTQRLTDDTTGIRETTLAAVALLGSDVRT